MMEAPGIHYNGHHMQIRTNPDGSFSNARIQIQSDGLLVVGPTCWLVPTEDKLLRLEFTDAQGCWRETTGPERYDSVLGPLIAWMENGL